MPAKIVATRKRLFKSRVENGTCLAKSLKASVKNAFMCH